MNKYMSIALFIFLIIGLCSILKDYIKERKQDEEMQKQLNEIKPITDEERLQYKKNYDENVKRLIAERIKKT